MNNSLAARLLALVAFAIPLGAQSPVFEVASIRPSKSSVNSAQLCHNLKPGTENLQLAGITLNLLIQDAYETVAERFDLPDWGRNKLDVSVKMPPNTNAATCRQMLMNLLAERFHLVVEVQTRDVPVYFLKVAKGGLKLKPVSGPPPDVVASGKSKRENGNVTWTFRSAPMSRVVIPIQTDIALGFRRGVYESDRLIDETGLSGYYDGQLEFTAATQTEGDALVAQAPALRDALIAQAGLMLEVRKAPGKTLVLRSADRTPAEN